MLAPGLWSAEAPGQSGQVAYGIGYLLLNTLAMAMYLIVQKKWIFLQNGRFFQWREFGVSATAWSYAYGSVIFAGLWAFTALERVQVGPCLAASSGGGPVRPHQSFA